MNESGSRRWIGMAVAGLLLVGLALLLFRCANRDPDTGGSLGREVPASAATETSAPDEAEVAGEGVAMRPDVGGGDGGDSEPDEANAPPLEPPDVGGRGEVRIPAADEEAITLMQAAIKADTTGSCHTGDQPWESAVNVALQGNATDRTKRMVVFNAAHRFARCAKNVETGADGTRNARARALYEELVDMGEGPFFHEAEQQLAALEG